MFFFGISGVHFASLNIEDFQYPECIRETKVTSTIFNLAILLVITVIVIMIMIVGDYLGKASQHQSREGNHCWQHL